MHNVKDTKQQSLSPGAVAEASKCLQGNRSFHSPYARIESNVRIEPDSPKPRSEMTMNPQATSELASFREYLDQRISDGESDLKPEVVLRDWRETQDSLQGIRRGLADADAGRVRPADDLLNELRARLTRR